ncbi:MAG TPA: thermonuclease family protein, partial [Gammaproteobacteria bacterium]|nr:thermonuclease family protein [Gammaproteobacteria bacterium]
MDAPESEQPFGTVSGLNLARLVFGKQVIVQYNDLDRCSRVFGKVIVNGQDAKLRQVQAGLAWHYKYYQSGQSPSDRQAYST